MTAKTVLTMEETPINAPFEYTFKDESGDVKIIEAQTYRQARHKLNKLTGNKKGYRLTQRKL